MYGEKPVSVIHELRCSEPFQRLGCIDLEEEQNIHSGGYVVDTLEASLWCLSCQNGEHTFRCDVLRAVNLGDDTDTTAAVTGGPAGIVYGIGPAENEWMNQLRNKKLIEEYIEKENFCEKNVNPCG